MKAFFISLLCSFCFFSLSASGQCTGFPSCQLKKVIFKYDSTHIKSESWFCGKVQDSIYKEWYLSGEIKTEGYYCNGIKNGTWKKWEFGSQDHKYGFQTFSEYTYGQLREERLYEFRDSTLRLFKVFSYTYTTDTHDTVRVQREFYTKTGIMTLMDTTINGIFNGVSKDWSEKDGRLLGEMYILQGKMQWRKYYYRDNSCKIDYYYDNGIVINEEFLYDPLGKLIEEKHFDEKGILISDKKY